MQAIQLAAPGGLDKLNVVDLEPRDPGPGEVRVRNHASSLNFHDYAVVTGLLPTEDKRIPMSDGAGVVEAVGEGVTGFAVGDKVMSVFFP
ncbi:MAG: alcohol dehydrogenase catalytic domain-containing protein, partial [Halieaceae bacterium]|nr:alcohol dehydrogenase catalytic domain-containing protein [Halieaceae bacterium]